MLKAKVPRSWVKRVLEVDGKDARVLDLDPELPLKDQRAALEDRGGGAAAVTAPPERAAPATDDRDCASRDVASPGAEVGVATAVGLPHAATFASVKAELAAMTARAGQGAAPPTLLPPDASRQAAPARGDARADLSVAAAAAAEARLARLRALRSGAAPAAAGGAARGSPRGRPRGATDIVGGERRRQAVDEGRRRRAATAGEGRRTFPRAAATTASGDGGAGSRPRDGNEGDLPLKDDPRFSKYFQMIRSRVPRSWVERVIEVDDRDPAILDLDPNKSLASQVGDDTDGIDTDESTSTSLVSGSLRSNVLSVGDKRAASDVADGAVEGGRPPITQIADDPKEDGDGQSETSTITTLRDTPSSSSVDLTRIGSFLDRMRVQLTNDSKDLGKGEVITASLSENEEATASRYLTMEDVEKSMAEILAYKKPREDGQNDISSDSKQLLEKSKADIAKLSAWLTSNTGEQADAAGTGLMSDQTSLEHLPALLSQVLQRLEQQSSASEPGKLKKKDNKALEALFAKKASLLDEQESQKKILCEDPEYSKYFKMLTLGLPRASVIRALEQDGKDVTVIDLDPKRPLEEQRHKSPAAPSKTAALEALFSKRAAEIKEKEESPNRHKALNALFAQRASNAATETQGFAASALKADPEYEKYFKMLQMGMPKETVRHALERDGKDPSIADMDPEQSLASQVKKKEDEVKGSDPPLKEKYAKYFKMLKIGLPPGAVQNALTKAGLDPEIINMDPEKSYSSQTKKEDSDPPIKEEYAKYFKMGLPPGAVQNALTKDGLDPEIINMDPEKSYKSQIKGGDDGKKDDGPPLKDDEKYMKYFKMLKMGLPLGAVQNALQKDGLDPEIINLDPERSLASQQKLKSKADQKHPKPKGPKISRKRLHWNKIDESTLHEDSFWNQAKDSSLQLVGLDIDNEEFASLFTSSSNKAAMPKKEAASNSKKSSSKQKVQLIDGRRRMNGSILLTKFKIDFKVLAKQVDNMECIEAEATELRAMMQLLPTKDESLALRSYLPPLDAPQSEYEESIRKLGECEQYMAVMLDVPDAKDKFQSMLFRANFESHTNNIREGAKALIEACDSVINSERFRKLLLYALKLGNALNTGGVNEEVTAITLDSLLKLAEAKAFDRQTSALHYLVSIVQKNDEDVLKLSEDLIPAKAAERVAMDILKKELQETKEGIELVKEVVKRNMPKTVAPLQETTKGQIDINENINGGETKKLDDGEKEAVIEANKEETEAVNDSNHEAGIVAKADVGANEVKAEEEDGENDDDSFKSCVSIEEKGEIGVQDSSDKLHDTTNDGNKFRSGWSSTPKVPNQIQVLPTNETREEKLLGHTAPEAPDQVQMLATSDMSEEELLRYTPMGRFSLSAASKIQTLSYQFDDSQKNFSKLLQFFGEDKSMTPEAFFCTINTFVSMFDQTHHELKRKQEAKERKKRIEEKKKLRDQEMAAKKVKSK